VLIYKLAGEILRENLGSEREREREVGHSFP